ncbi:MAG: class I SAM-dependent methyltransferase [Pseudomonadota bacterium]
MTDWTDGYVTDIEYAYAYCQELNPVRATLALLSKGLAVPEFETACELGFGQGLATNLHAAASATHWYGTDFMPGQVAFAQDLNRISDADARLFDESFEEFVHRSDLPDFDFIGLHGVWSWINEDNRDLIVSFLRTRLKPGGIVYLGYNAAPGWSGFAPLRHLMKQFGETMVAPSTGGIDGIAGAVGFADQFLKANPAFAAANPMVVDRFEKVKTQDPAYLAHEYFCANWHPVYFSDMAARLGAAKLAFAAPARYLDHLDVLNLTPEQSGFLEQIPDPVFRESTRDMMIARRFRSDYWIKGSRTLLPGVLGDRLRAQRVVLLRPRTEVSLVVRGGLREVEMQEAVYGPILDALAGQQPIAIGAVEAAVAENGLTLPQVVQALLVLGGDNHLAPAQSEEVVATARQRTDALNRHIVKLAREGAIIDFLASPVTGGGIRMGRIQHLFLDAHLHAGTSPADWVDHVWPILAAQGQKIIKDGTELQSDAENRAALLEQAERFANTQLPVFQALQLV